MTLSLLVPLVACGCGSALSPALPSRCQVRGPLPDPRCTPGAADPRVSQQNLGETICARGYARRVRPPERYTQPLKRAQMAAYGFYAGRSPGSYEEDHLVPLELGGAPADPRNLWPERRSGSAGSDAKDVEEDLLHRRVCARAEPLAAARRAIAADWYAAYKHDRAGAG
jgi:hypothetical protein